MRRIERWWIVAMQSNEHRLLWRLRIAVRSAFVFCSNGKLTVTYRTLTSIHRSFVLLFTRGIIRWSSCCWKMVLRSRYKTRTAKLRCTWPQLVAGGFLLNLASIINPLNSLKHLFIPSYFLNSSQLWSRLMSQIKSIGCTGERGPDSSESQGRSGMHGSPLGVLQRKFKLCGIFARPESRGIVGRYFLVSKIFLWLIFTIFQNLEFHNFREFEILQFLKLLNLTIFENLECYDFWNFRILEFLNIWKFRIFENLDIYNLLRAYKFYTLKMLVSLIYKTTIYY